MRVHQMPVWLERPPVQQPPQPKGSEAGRLRAVFEEIAAIQGGQQGRDGRKPPNRKPQRPEAEEGPDIAAPAVRAPGKIDVVT